MPFEWSVAIFTARESLSTLVATIEAARLACTDKHAIIDVLVNGNQSLATRTGQYVKQLSAGVTLRVWHIAVPDKALAWNEYIHRIWPGAALAFFIDGYAQVKPDALRLLEQGLAEHPAAQATAAVPSCGPSAKAMRASMLSQGGVHGNLYGLRGSVVSALRARGFRLPLGIYRNDGLLMAVIAFGLEPATHQWDMRRIFVHPEATWDINSAQAWWQPAAWSGHFNRRLRQAQGALENCAIRQHLAREHKAPESLPRTTAELIDNWTSAFPGEAKRLLWRRPLCYFAARKLRHARALSTAETHAALLAQCGRDEESSA